MQISKFGKSDFLRFILSKKFFLNLGISIILLLIMLLLALKFLDIYTRHGKEITVPDFYGMTFTEIDSAKYNRQFDFFIIDSLYDEDNMKGSIVIQEPLPGSKVKKGRNIYVTIVASTPEQVIMPDLKDLTLRQAINILESGKLKAGRLIYSPSFDKNAVLEQLFKGDTIMPGDTLKKGSLIDLIIGTGERFYKIPIPFLIGKTREEAIYDLNIASFNLGNEFYMDSIRDEHARVFMQEPVWDSDMPYYPGDSIHLWYKSEEFFNFDEYLKTFLPDTLKVDSIKVSTLISN
ncbi:MAG: PASTA domain-containing protein [Bacteroidetes bacterium]|nr:PASTA domain-containing protein [Bacteroidota bacterium]